MKVKYDIFRYGDDGTLKYPQVCLGHLADGRSLHGGRIYTHTTVVIVTKTYDHYVNKYHC